MGLPRFIRENGMKALSRVLFTGVFALFLSLAPDGAQASPGWPVWQGNNARTGSVEGDLGIEKPGLAWRRNLGGSSELNIFDVDGDGSLELFSVEGGGPILWSLAGTLLWDREPLGIDGCRTVRRLDGNDSGKDLLCKGPAVVVILDGRNGETLWTLPDGLVDRVGSTWLGGPENDPHLVVADLATGNAGDGAVHLFRLAEESTTPKATADGDDRDFKSGATVAVILDADDKPAEFVVAGDAHIYFYSAVDGALVSTLAFPDKVPYGQAHLFVDAADVDGKQDLLLIRDYNRDGKNYNSVSRIHRVGSVVEESFRREWPEATDQNCPKSPILPDGRIVTSIKEPDSGWSIVLVEGEEGHELARYDERILKEVFVGPNGTPHILMKSASKGSADVTDDTWLKRGAEAPRNLGPRRLVRGEITSDSNYGIGRVSDLLSGAGLLPMQIFQKPNPVPIGVEILDLATLEPTKTITPSSTANQIFVGGDTEPVFVFTEVSGALRVYDQEGSVLNPVTVDGDPAPRQGTLLPRWPQFGEDATGQRVLVVEGEHHGRLAFLGDGVGPSSVLYARAYSPPTLAWSGQPTVFGSYNVIWQPDLGAVLIFAQANGNSVWTSALPEFDSPPTVRSPVISDFDDDGVDDILLLLQDTPAGLLYMILISGADGMRLAEPLTLNAVDSSLRGLTLLSGDPPRVLVNVHNTVYAVEVNGLELKLADSVVPGHTMGAPIVLDEATASGVRVVLGGTYQGMQGLNDALEPVWEFLYPALHGPGIAVPNTPSGAVAVATPRQGPILLGVDADTGALRWSAGFVSGQALPVGNSAVVDSSYRLGTLSAATNNTNATVFVGSSDGFVYAVDAETGELRFSIFTGGAVGGVIPADVDSDGSLELVAAVSNGSLVAIDNAELPSPAEVAELPPGDIQVVELSGDIDFQENAEEVRVAFSPVEDAVGYEVRLLSANGNAIGIPKQTTGTEIVFGNLGLALEVFLHAEVRTEGKEAYSVPAKSDGVRVRDISPPTIGEVLIDGVENDGLVPRASSVLMSVRMEDLTRLGEISLRVTISRDGTQLAKAVEYVGQPERKLTLKVPLGDLALDEQIRVEAKATDLAEHAVERTWVLRIVDPNAVDEGDASGSSEPSDNERRMPPDTASSSSAQPEDPVELEDSSSGGGSSSCSASAGLRTGSMNGYWYLLFLLCYILFSIRRRAPLARAEIIRRENSHGTKSTFS